MKVNEHTLIFIMLSGQYFSTSASNNSTGLQLCLWRENVQIQSVVLILYGTGYTNKIKESYFNYHFWNGALNSRPSKWPDTDVIVTVTFWRRMETEWNKQNQRHYKHKWTDIQVHGCIFNHFAVFTYLTKEMIFILIDFIKLRHPFPLKWKRRQSILEQPGKSREGAIIYAHVRLMGEGALACMTLSGAPVIFSTSKSFCYHYIYVIVGLRIENVGWYDDICIYCDTLQIC